VNVQGRYVAAPVVLFWLALFSSVRLKHSLDSEKWIRTITIVLTAMMVVMTVASSSKETVLTARQLIRGEDPSSHEQWQIAEGLREKGLVPTDKVAYVGRSLRASWAHLLGLRIVAEIQRDKVVRYWEADANVKANLLDAFANTGVKAIVIEDPPSGTDLTGWQRIRQTNHYVLVLR
jgi:hypothetical protein